MLAEDSCCKNPTAAPDVTTTSSIVTIVLFNTCKCSPLAKTDVKILF